MSQSRESAPMSMTFVGRSVGLLCREEGVSPRTGPFWFKHRGPSQESGDAVRRHSPSPWRAAANLGGIAEALAGRPGSWEPSRVEDLNYSTVGTDLADLWQYRAKPVLIVADVDDLLSERIEAWSQYDQAEQFI